MRSAKSAASVQIQAKVIIISLKTLAINTSVIIIIMYARQLKFR